jgi:hypothetical protein
MWFVVFKRARNCICRVTARCCFGAWGHCNVFCRFFGAYYHKVKIGYAEAGLLTGDIYSLWPEEANRKLTRALANYHFAPTQSFYNN